MDIEVFAIGGYSEVGRNMTALRINDDVIICDMGFHVQKIVDFEEEGGNRLFASTQDLVKADALPDDKILEKYRKNVRAIVLGHAHLDHIAAVPYLASKYKAPIYATPFTLSVLRNILKDDSKKLTNELKPLNPNSVVKINDNLQVEFIHMTHSTLQTVTIAIHTRKGTIIYANDFKFDNSPVLGKKPNYARLKQLGKENVIALIIDSLYSKDQRKTPSELVAREMLKDVLLGIENKGDAILATTFASNIARLKSFIDFGKILDRKVVFLGRSMRKYVSAAEEQKLVNFSKDAEIIGFASQIKKKLKKIEKQGKSKYLIVCTGSQGEQTSVLNKIMNNIYNFDLSAQDHIIFSCKTIPVEPNITNRRLLEEKLLMNKVRIFKEIHVSGHGSKEDIHDFIKMINPKHIIPSHGEQKLRLPMIDLAKDLGYDVKDVHIPRNGTRLRIS